MDPFSIVLGITIVSICGAVEALMKPSEDERREYDVNKIQHTAHKEMGRASRTYTKYVDQTTRRVK